MQKSKTDMARIITGSWKEELRELPDYIKDEIRKTIAVNQALQRLKFGIIDIKEFRERMDEIIDENPPYDE